MATHSSILAWEIPWTEEPGVHGVAESQTQLRDFIKIKNYFTLNIEKWMKMTECENLISFIGLSQQKIKDKVAYMTEIYCLEARRPNQGCEQD